ncbi:hypothetical protein [Corallococcus sp. AB049A]|nr:hypothetical protein [Corallococcus sp. AB049A]
MLVCSTGPYGSWRMVDEALRLNPNHAEAQSLTRVLMVLMTD